jgi:DNA-binding response OmpR family regulator
MSLKWVVASNFKPFFAWNDRGELRSFYFWEMDDKNHTCQILIVEDEPSIAEGLVDVCEFKGYKTRLCRTGEEGLQAALEGKFDLVLLDLMLPGMDGFTVCDRIREVDRQTPIIILTAKTSEQDIIEGLRLGADDYVSKPFSIGQLFARVEAVLRRTMRSTERKQELRLGKLTIYFREFLGRNGNEEIPFTRKEIEVLEYLWKNSQGPVSRQELLAEVWGYDNASSVDTRTVDIHITKLRKKVEVSPSAPRHLITLRGEGYQLLFDAEAQEV